jgi:hypothetical protein
MRGTETHATSPERLSTPTYPRRLDAWHPEASLASWHSVWSCRHGEDLCDVGPCYLSVSRKHVTGPSTDAELGWCVERGIAPLTAERCCWELYVRWMQEGRRDKRGHNVKRGPTAARPGL